MRTSVFFLGVLTSLQVTGQIPLGEEEVEVSPVQPIAADKEDEELIERLARQIRAQNSLRRIVPEKPSSVPPYFKAVQDRLATQPKRVRIKVTLSEGVLYGERTNEVFDVRTSVGEFPVAWSEVVFIRFTEQGALLSLKHGDTLEGRVNAVDLLVEREDASFQRIPIRSIKRIDVIHSDAHSVRTGASAGAG